MLLMGVSLQSLVDFVVAGVSLAIGLGIFTFVASVLCSVTFFHKVKEYS